MCATGPQAPEAYIGPVRMALALKRCKQPKECADSVVFCSEPERRGTNTARAPPCLEWSVRVISRRLDMKKRTLFSGIALAIMVFGVSGCGRKTQQSAEMRVSPEEQQIPRIAVIPKGTTHVFWQSVHAGAAKAAHDLGCKVFWNGPATEGQREAQFKVVEDMIARSVNAIVLAPLDSKALVPAIKRSTQAGIPVVIMDSAAETDDYVSFVATDNLAGGVKAADTLAGLLGGKGRVLLVRYNPGSASTADREKGFEQTLAAKYPGMKIVAAEYGKTTVSTALAVVEDMLAKVPEFDGIFACNESTAVGALRALKNHKLAGKVRFVAFDASPTLVNGLKAKEIDALIAQNPFKMGYEATKAAFDKLAGKTVERRIDTGVSVITRENLSDPAIAPLIDIDMVKKWLK